ncbi:sugar phosphate isomerase/epimerase family protein [Ruicaihuangia caeni]|uniref:Sugar phosphate isomerase/epimerase family protein n=1 Tax=Ruicaihuangia caeni TaxID=3042517 RepID=A0AAW6T5V8_9MICO|nr:sugar phosphate isomerase/epimerase family protein [Klugiella sp. YN-L-19]MDI2099215.1 sugar phosphate isomerase/epimerase family protein [Klugiella sp. YN-L-19]
MAALSIEQITGTNFSYQHMTFERFLDDMVALERRHLELWGIANHLYIPEFSFADARRMKAQLDERDQDVVCITPESVMYPVNLASSIPWIRESAIATLKKAADICVDLGSPLLFLTPGRGFEDESRDEAWKRSVDGIAQVAQYAASLGVDCVLEPLQRHESNLVNNSEQLAQMLAEVGEGNVGVALDTVAMATAEETVACYVKRFGDGIRHVHLIDGRPAGHMAWGDGELPLDQYLDDLADAGYSGYMTFEIFGAKNTFEPFDAHRRSLAAVESALAAA